jgi:uncharacterized SAM-dependent methyltransferase
MNATTDVQIFEAKSLAPLDAREALIDEVWRGLLKRPRSLEPWMLYDAEGSRLFECITTLPEYYLTRTERAILGRHSEAIVTATGADYSRPLRLLELGAGTAAKTGILLREAARLRNEVIYFPVDVSPDALDEASASVACYRMCSYSLWWRTMSLTRRNSNDSGGTRSPCTSVRASATSRRRRRALFFAI